MILKGGNAFIDGTFCVTDLEVVDGVITRIEPFIESDDTAIDCTGYMLWPGWFDIDTHGCLGYDFSKSTAEEMLRMCICYAQNGVTSILATTMTN